MFHLITSTPSRGAAMHQIVPEGSHFFDDFSGTVPYATATPKCNSTQNSLFLKIIHDLGKEFERKYDVPTKVFSGTKEHRDPSSRSSVEWQRSTRRIQKEGSLSKLVVRIRMQRMGQDEGVEKTSSLRKSW